MKLSKRLNAIYSFIDKNDIVADIGCDHAQLCCALVKDKGVAKAYACDIAQGPLNQAQKNIEYYNLQDCINTVLSSGLDNLENDVTCIVIAGMGFETVLQILEENRMELNHRKCIIQVNRDVEGLRRWISEHQFHIVREQCIFDERYYQIVVFDTNKDVQLRKEEIVFGKKMIHDDNFYSFWKYNLSKQEAILRQLDEKHPRYIDVFDQMKAIYQVLGSK